MKTFNHLFDKITRFDNLLLAAQKAQKGKRKKQCVAAFHFRFEENIIELQETLKKQSYKPGKYRTFYVFDPKERMISAAPYRDRVVHHALCNIIEPLFENTFIEDSYANRKGKGTHRAINRYQFYAKKYKYVLKCDLRKFFPSIDHELLKLVIRKKISCSKTLWLMDLIIDNSNEQEGLLQWFPGDNLFTPLDRKKGLPIGNLTSQFLGNVYLNEFDHFVKEKLHAKGYIRYVDDFVLFDDSKAVLNRFKQEIIQYLSGLRQMVHPDKTQIFKVEKGVPFLGFTVYPFFKHIRKEKTKRYHRYLKKQLKKRESGLLSPQALEDSLNAWLGHARFGESKRLEYIIFM